MEEWREMKDYTTVIWTTRNGVNGRVFTASNGNSIFIPAAGYRSGSSLKLAGSYGGYWSSSLYPDSPSYVWTLDFNSGSYYMSYGDRQCGQSVRPVHSASKN